MGPPGLSLLQDFGRYVKLAARPLRSLRGETEALDKLMNYDTDDKNIILTSTTVSVDS